MSLPHKTEPPLHSAMNKLTLKTCCLFEKLPIEMVWNVFKYLTDDDFLNFLTYKFCTTTPEEFEHWCRILGKVRPIVSLIIHTYNPDAIYRKSQYVLHKQNNTVWEFKTSGINEHAWAFRLSVVTFNEFGEALTKAKERLQYHNKVVSYHKTLGGIYDNYDELYHTYTFNSNEQAKEVARLREVIKTQNELTEYPTPRDSPYYIYIRGPR